MGDMRAFTSDTASQDGRVVSIDPYALVEAIMGSSLERRQMSPATVDSDGLQADYDDLTDLSHHDRDNKDRNGGNVYGPRPDQQPKNVCVGAANPYALVEALLGRRIDKSNADVAKVMSNVLQTDYDELFDMRNNSVLHAGLRLDEKNRRAEQYKDKDVRILNERDLISPDLSRVQRLKDLKQIGLKDVEDARVKLCRLQNGKLRLIVNANQLGRTVTNRDFTLSINDLCTPFRRNDKDNRRWMPPNGSWRDITDGVNQLINRRLVEEITMFRIGNPQRPYMPQFTTYNRFDDPTQGCSTNSWLIAAIFSVFWADPCVINRDTRLFSGRNNNNNNRDRFDEDNRDNRSEQRLAIKFHDKGGDNNNKTETVEVNYEIPTNNSNNEPLYCRSSDGADIWPALYEKAFAKWITGSNSDRPDITQTHCGDPVKAMAQINGRDMQYFNCEKHSPNDLLGLVRANCVSLKTINPMAAWTHATGRNEDDMYRGSNIVANHAYSVLGYALIGDRQFFVLRNPWGVTEPQGLTSYPGLVSRVEANFWEPAALLDHGGLFALEAEAFRRYFAYIGVAK